VTGDPYRPLLWRKRLASRVRNVGDTVLRPFRPSRIAARRSGPLNLLALAVDTLRYDHLGYAGYAPATSVHLDRLAEAGTCFDDVTAASPWTLPSFASALSGLVPSLHRAGFIGPVLDMDSQPPRRLERSVVTLATHLRRHGYRTAAFYSNQFFAFGLAETFDRHAYFNVPAGDLTAIAMEWVRRHADRPFFCFVLLNDPHEPTTPPPADLEPMLAALAQRDIRPSAAELRALAGWGGLATGGIHLGQTPQPLTPAAERVRQIKLAIYDATIRYVDRTIGATVQQLAEWGLDANTLLTVFSDHGEEFLDHATEAGAWNHDPRDLRAIGHGHTQFQELLHVPWLTTGPNVPAGVRRREPVSLCDFAPTMAEWLGVEPFDLPPAAVDGLVGRSLAGSSPADRILLAEALAYGPDLVAIRQESWKLIASRAGDVFGLYDLATDPNEKTDLTAARPDIARHLLAHLAAWRAVKPGEDDPGSATSWNDVDATVRQRLKDLGYTD